MLEEYEYTKSVVRVIKMIDSNGANGRALYRILQLVADEPIELGQLEDKIAATTEFATCTQPPYSLIEWLVNEGSLEILEYDVEDKLIGEEDKAGLSEDQIDDLVRTLRVGITQIGCDVLEECDPVSRYEILAKKESANTEAFLNVLEFLSERKSFSEIDRFLRESSEILAGGVLGMSVSQPSSLVGKLAQAGLVSFDNGWLITPEGCKVLNACYKR